MQSIKKQFQIALVRYSITANPVVNLKKIMTILQKLRRRKPDYIVLPEMWLGGPQNLSQRKDWLTIYRQAFPQMQEFARKNKIGFFLSQLEENRRRFYNTAYFMEKTGKIKGTFRKVHLFNLGGENKIFSPGTQVTSFKSSIGKIACVVCYDIRFPELIRRLAHQGAQVLFVCAQWPAKRAHHWLTLLAARAIENQFFVVATNRLGKKQGQTYRGDSVVFSPWGKTLLHLGKNKEWGMVGIDLREVKKIRDQYPFFKERKLPPD